MAEIKFEIIGDSNFLRNIEYLAYLPGLVNELQEKFQLAERVQIEFVESVCLDLNNPKRSELTVLENGSTIELKYITNIYHQPKGGLSKPSPTSFLTGFRFYMENTVVKEDNERANMSS